MKKIILILFLFLCGCSAKNAVTATKNKDIENETSPSPVIEDIYLPSAPQIEYYIDDLVDVDYSNVDQGYICVTTLTEEHDRLKIRISKGEENYNYDINEDYVYITYPLNLGDGDYTVRILENIEDTNYAVVCKMEFSVTLENDTIAYLYPSIMVDYSEDSIAVKKSFELTEGIDTELERLKVIYSYIVNTVEYDYDKVEEANNKLLLPEVDETLEKEKGICQDYAALMSAMLRVQKIPCKIITGFVDEGYHAWVEVYIHNIGWINPQVYFEKETWTQVDPTFDAQGKKYDGDYTEKYQY